MQAMAKYYRCLVNAAICISLLLLTAILIMLLLNNNINWHSNEYNWLIFKRLPAISDVSPNILVHLAIVGCNNRSEETITLIKSALIFSNCSSLHFHIFVDNSSYIKVNKAIQNYTDICHSQSINFTIYDAAYPIEYNTMQNLFRPCSSLRLLFPDILKQLDAVIYVDSDALFLADPAKLWNFFSKFNEKQLIAIGANSNDWYQSRWVRKEIQFVKPTGLNSGVLLMNLTRLRNFNWTTHIKHIAQNYASKLQLGDQDIINILFSNTNTDRYFELTCDWNYNCFKNSRAPCMPANDTGAKLVHAYDFEFHKDINRSSFSSLYNILKLHQMDRNQSNICSNLLPKIENAMQNLSQSASCYTDRLELIRHVKLRCMLMW